MEYIKTKIEGVWICEPHIFDDASGYFMETWREEDFNKNIGKKIIGISYFIKINVVY